MQLADNNNTACYTNFVIGKATKSETVQAISVAF